MEVLKRSLFTLIAMLFIAISSAQDKVVAFSKSYELEADKQYLAAVSTLKLLKINSYAVNLRIGWLFYLNGNYKESVAYYVKAIQLRPTAIEARFGYILPAAKLKMWKNVAAQYDAILKLDPQNSKANYYRGLMFYNVGEYSKAEPYFDRVEQMYPFDYDIVILSAWNSYFLKRYDKAKLLFNQALLIQPQSASAKEGISLCH
ncbi:MAG: tetratricopeptide repeat protein [Paludibacteraceae bacterium]|nr:tetratricopeptide repeat protein [Paludibacteraceae bacterium]